LSILSESFVNAVAMRGQLAAMTVRSVGVEEELLLVAPDSGRPLAVAESALRAASQAGSGQTADEDHLDSGEGGPGLELQFELQRQQLETSTRPCRSLSELRAELGRGRSLAAGAAARAGARVAALATSPVPVEPALVRKGRYLMMAQAYGLTAHEQLTCGCHVHVGVSSPEEGIGVLDRIRPWLPVLLAVSANSPYWQGQDTGYASYRYQAWSRWPTAGPTDAFGTVEAYQRTIREMVGTGTLLDSGMVYFDARLSEHYPTIEIRIADVCLRADDAVLVAALVRALVETEARAWQAGDGVSGQRVEMLRLASWRASRSGLEHSLLSPVTGLPESAPVTANALFDHVRDAIDEGGDAAATRELLDAVLARGNGAAFQRAAFEADGAAAMIGRAADITAG
jgi:glutamate---cysteine ligase / carboxylate-amine ligase